MLTTVRYALGQAVNARGYATSVLMLGYACRQTVCSCVVCRTHACMLVLVDLLGRSLGKRIVQPSQTEAASWRCTPVLFFNLHALTQLLCVNGLSAAPKSALHSSEAYSMLHGCGIQLQPPWRFCDHRMVRLACGLRLAMHIVIMPTCLSCHHSNQHSPVGRLCYAGQPLGHS